MIQALECEETMDHYIKVQRINALLNTNRFQQRMSRHYIGFAPSNVLLDFFRWQSKLIGKRLAPKIRELFSTLMQVTSEHMFNKQYRTVVEFVPLFFLSFNHWTPPGTI